MWGSNEGREWMSLGGVGHVELSEGFFGLTQAVQEGRNMVDGKAGEEQPLK